LAGVHFQQGEDVAFGEVEKIRHALTLTRARRSISA
jgi:hypothetical protein